ncbi:MAG: thermonuclease family protein [Armatimonadetes bacterium]|nr:thermonuclease family protein [Armatimonadota bacterium]MDW8028714.1 thermonuclease family protein [Armatimonadota bacterium]
MERKRRKFEPKPFRRIKIFKLPLALVAFSLLIAFVSQRQIMRSPKTIRTGLKVIKVIDGDTIVLSNGQTVRYIGIDTPERDQPFYDAAKNFNRKLVQNKTVELELDVERYDHYGRLLAYVFVRDKSGRRIFVNAEMVRNGFARTYTKPPNVKYSDLLVNLQEEARRKGRGLWAVYKPTRSPVIGNKRTKVFHRPNCPFAKKINPSNRIRFRNAKLAIEQGFQPCRECQP